MKFPISTILILLAIFGSAAQAQSSNCCGIQIGGVQLSGGTFSVPPSASGPGGLYYPSLTETYPIACINAQTNKACNSTGMPNNVVTATGAGANYNGTFVQCNPTFRQSTSQATTTSGTPATFTNQATGYTSVDSTSGACVQQNPQPFHISSCIVVACSTPTPICTICPKLPPLCCTCPCGSPIIIDITGKGFSLTSAQNGVMFDITGEGKLWQMGWIAQGADNAFLALPGADGLVHSGKQLFGNFTPQPPSADPNGFAALAVYDDPKNGGNGDGVIDSRDAIFASLRLWIDANHDGISQPDEIHTLPSLGVNSISLNYKSMEKTDQYGNVFGYRARVNGNESQDVGQTAYDVFFVVVPPVAAKNNLLNREGPKCAVPTKGVTKGGMLSTSSR